MYRRVEAAMHAYCRGGTPGLKNGARLSIKGVLHIQDELT